MSEMISLPNANITFGAGSVSISFVIPDLTPIITALSDLGAKVDSLAAQGNQVLSNQTTNQGAIMSAFDDLEGKMTDLEGAEQVVEATLDAIHQELVDMLTTGATPQRVQALADRVDQLKGKVMDAVARDPDPNAAPPPPPPPGP